MRRLVQMLMSLVYPASGRLHCLWSSVRLRTGSSLPLAVDSWYLHPFPLLPTDRFCLVILTNIGTKFFSLMYDTSKHDIISGPQTRTYSHGYLYLTLGQDM